MKDNKLRGINDYTWCTISDLNTLKNVSEPISNVRNFYWLSVASSSVVTDTPMESKKSTLNFSTLDTWLSRESLIDCAKTKSNSMLLRHLIDFKYSDSSATATDPCTTSLNELEEKNYKIFSAHLYDILRNDSFVDGETCNTEVFLKKQFAYLGRKQTLDFLMRFYLPSYRNYHMMCGLMHALSHFEYKDVSPQGPILALALFTHKDIEVKEFSLKAFENWIAKESIPLLETTVFGIDWLDIYRESVIAYIKG